MLCDSGRDLGKLYILTVELDMFSLSDALLVEAQISISF